MASAAPQPPLSPPSLPVEPHPTRAPASPPAILPAFQASAELGDDHGLLPTQRLSAMVDDGHAAQIAAPRQDGGSVIRAGA